MVDASAKTPRFGLTMRDVRHRPRSNANPYALDQMRRLADLLVACVLLTITAPLMLLVAIAIKFDSPGPALERQNCIAQGGRRFQMLKFRTRHYDPDGMRPAGAYKPTRLGEFLRLTRIEALPQLINVLRGDLSVTDPKRRSPSFLD